MFKTRRLHFAGLCLSWRLSMRPGVCLQCSLQFCNSWQNMSRGAEGVEQGEHSAM